MLYSFYNGNFSERVELSAEESHHLVSVRRAREGERVILLDGRGGKADAVLERASAKRAELRVREVQNVPRPNVPVWLVQAVPLGKTMDGIVQKAAELGCERVIPLSSKRSEMKLDQDRAQKKLGKWQTVALEAIKQCGNPFMPEIDAPVSVEQLMAMDNLPPLRLVCSLESGAKPLMKAVLEAAPTLGAVLAIGPEGDFSQQEYALFADNGFVPVTLGPLVLRSDTAATSSIAIVAEALRFAACALSDNV